MAIAWTTVALLVFLLPGFVFSFGLLAQERFSRDTTPRSPVAQLAAIVAVAFVVHSALLCLLGLVLRWVPLIPSPDLWFVLGALQSGSNDAPTVRELAKNVSENLFWISVYVVLSTSVGFELGRRVADFAVSHRGGRWKFLLEHDWVYDLFPPPGGVGDFTYAYLLTKVQHEGKLLLYRGPLAQFGIRQDGSFSYLLLRQAMRFCIDLEKPSERSSGARPVSGTPAEAREVDYLYVAGEEVANVYFVRLPLDLSEKAVSDLSKKAVAELRLEAKVAAQATVEVQKVPGGGSTKAPHGTASP